MACDSVNADPASDFLLPEFPRRRLSPDVPSMMIRFWVNRFSFGALVSTVPIHSSNRSLFGVMMHQIKQSAVWLSFGLILGSAIAGCGGGSEASPEEVFKAFTDDFKAKKYASAMSYLDDDSQNVMAGSIAFGAGFIAALTPDSEPLTKILEAHGLKDDEKDAAPIDLNSPTAGIKAIGAKIKDKPNFVNDVMTWLDENGQGKSSEMPFSSATLSDLKIDGEKATATMVAGTKKSPIEFHKVGNAWKIHITDAMLSSGRSTPTTDTSSFPDGSGPNESFTFQNEWEESDELPPSSPISLADYEAAWKVDMNQVGSAAEVIGELAKQCNLELTGIDEVETELATEVKIAAKGQSRLQIIEDAASQAGLYPDYQLRGLTLKPGKRSLPVVFSGPFLFEISEFRTQPPYPVGNLSVRCVGAGLPTNVVARIKEMSGFGASDRLGIEFDAINSGGTDLSKEPGGTQFFGDPMFTKSGVRIKTSVSVMNLIRKIEMIDTFKGSFSFSLVAEASTVKFDAAGDAKEVGSGKLTLKTWTESVTLKYEKSDKDRLTIVGRDVSGKRMNGKPRGSFSFGDRGEMTVSFEEKPTSVEIQVADKTESVKYPFSFQTIPVPNFAQMPEKLLKLEFTGSAPVAFQFGKLVTKDFGGQAQRNAVFNVTNSSNKGLTGYQLKLIYLDSTGKKLKDFPHSMGATPNQFPRPGKTKPMDVHLAFSPAETAKVGVEVQKVYFTDGTEWKASDQ
jgi:hypothetical protein